VRYLTANQILLIHSALIDEIGGTHGVRDRHAVLSVENAPQQTFEGKELYPTPFDKAAVYARNIIMHHPFIDGNKRTGMTAAAVFLENNDYKVIAKRGEIEHCALKIINRKFDIPAIAAWFKNHSQKSK